MRSSLAKLQWYNGVPCFKVNYYYRDLYASYEKRPSLLPLVACKPRILRAFCTMHNALFVTCDKYGCNHFLPYEDDNNNSR